VPKSPEDTAVTFEAVLQVADDQHRLLLETILSGDAEGADKLAQEHSLRTLHRLDDVHNWQEQIRYSGQRKRRSKSARGGAG
jgi:DNA-binding GntR family transcriptional regulator